MDQDARRELGQIKIHQDVVTSITVEAAEEIPGVVRVGKNLKSYIYEFIGLKKLKAVKLEFDMDNEAVITVPIVVKYGHNVVGVASKVQDNVKMSVESATNIIVKNVNVIIQEIERGRRTDEGVKDETI